MAKVSIKFRVRGSFLKGLKDVLASVFGKNIQKNFGDFRPFVEDAIDEGVINSRSEFIPDDGEAAELGVGVGGSIDRSRTQGAWTQLLVGSSEKIITFTVRKNKAKNKIGTISVNINEEALFQAPLSNIDTDSEELPSIPWMEWLIEGAPAGAVLPDFDFTNIVPQSSKSRTGAGRMITVEGGIWTFSPASAGAFRLLTKEIQRQIEVAVRRDIGKVL